MTLTLDNKSREFNAGFDAFQWGVPFDSNWSVSKKAGYRHSRQVTRKTHTRIMQRTSTNRGETRDEHAVAND